MADTVTLGIATAESLARDALIACRTSAANARPTARALVAAEVDGQPGHGMSRVLTYGMQSRAGKVDGFATPRLEQVAAAAVRIDAALGFAYPAIDLAIEALAPLTRRCGIATAAIHRSHHFGQAGAHAERLALQGLVALVVSNTPKAMAPWGGRSAMLGTNPLAFAAPLGSGDPLVIDLALSVAARAKIVAAERAGQAIPEGWAVDREGRPTTDATEALAGSLAPIGRAKGSALALMIEALAAALTGSHFGWEASSMFDAEGGPPNLGHVLIAFEPELLSGGAYRRRIGDLASAIAGEPGARLPGTKRLANRARAAREGITIPAALHASIRALLG